MSDLLLIIVGCMVVLLLVRWACVAWILKRDAEHRREEMRRHVR